MSVRRMLRVTLGLALTATAVLTGTAQAGDRTTDTAAARAAAGEQLLHFNHAYAVVDRETADAIEHSAYLPEFAHFEVRTTTGADLTWTGRYVIGRETYLEFFGEDDLPGQDAESGASGLAVSTERAGDLAAVTQHLRDRGAAPVEGRQTRDFGDGVPVPWFDALFPSAEPYEAFSTWGMEYLPEYFADPRSGTGPEAFPGDVGRYRYLPDDYRDHLLRDITGVHLGVPAADLAPLIPMLEAGGYTLHTLPGGGVTVDDGLTLIRLDPVPREEAGLRTVHLSLNEAPGDRHVERIGNSTLTVGPADRAVWTFDAP
ncbi:DUF5829 family protein [Streptomyces sp. XM4011]|uniref:DUF5829 family protein n=1 Tax=Streptomyces sp. XM4011 TaxID=2929780 RepID=UPI001FF98165|nr:DUF5829 family protein [Streptomyces sp. XM4011]MCK1814776.1 DUF5829 family protein [Streptomyces sp. XM4011]